MADKKEKRYVSDNAQLMSEWNWEKNTELGIDPQLTAYQSNKNAWWKCNKGHEWQARIAHRAHGHGCPFCSGLRPIVGKSDLQTCNPTLANEWNYEKNGELTPQDVSPNSGKKVWWKCSYGHEWQAIISNRNKGHSCPLCSGRTVVTGVNDFASYDSRLLREWDFSKNTVDPNTISPNYYRKVWWIGECGHSWSSSVYSRTKMGTNCPICSQERHASVSEKSVLYYIKKHISFEVLENYRDENIQLELDIYIPNIKTAIEYDGERWHRNIDKDIVKDDMCFRNGIRLIRIREKGCPEYNSHSIKINLPNNKTSGIEEGIYKLFQLLLIESADINIDRDLCDILTMINFMVKEQSLLSTHPDIAKEWHPTKNGNLKPEHTKPNSNKNVWWVCPLGHEYQLEVYFRTKRKNSCPICSGHRVQVGYNDLASQTSSLAQEWNYNKNGDLKPEHVTASSGKKVWWVCEKGHEWETTVAHRAAGQGCPYCSGRKILIGKNDLQTVNPTLASEWNYEKNHGLTPTEVMAGSGKKVWWKCNCGYEWQATIYNRNNGRGCPRCAKEKRKTDK